MYIYRLLIYDFNGTMYLYKTFQNLLSYYFIDLYFEPVQLGNGEIY